MKNKHIGIGLVVIVVVVGLLIVFVGGILAHKPSPGLRVGVVLPLTGNFAALGEHAKNGYEMARANLSSVNVVYEDACQPKDAVSALNKMIQEDKITVMGGSFCVVGFVPMLPILDQNKIIGFNLAPNPDSTLGHQYFISTNSSIKLKAGELGKFAANTLKAKTAAIIYYNTPLGEDYRKYFQESYEQNGGKVISSQVTLVDATDFRTELTKVKALNPDLIFVVQLSKPLANLLTESRDLGISAKLLGNSQNEDQTIIDAAGKAALGFLISSDEPMPKTAVVEDFNARYFAKYGQQPDVFARNAYDSLTLQAQAYAKCGANSDCMLEYLHSVKDFQGVSGTITIQADGTAYKPTTFKVVNDGKFVQY